LSPQGFEREDTAAMTVITEEQTMLQDAARAWAAERAPVTALRAVRSTHVETGFDPQLYAEMVEMGWTGIIVPEAYGGFDFGYASFGIVAEELGRSLTASPLLGSAITSASTLILGGSEAQKTDLLPRIVAGDLIATLALEEGAHHAPNRIALKAERADGDWRLNGVKQQVPEGMAAGLFIVAARTSGTPGDAGGMSLFLCPTDAPGISRTALRQIDSRGAAIVKFRDVALPADALLGALDGGLPLLEQTLDRTRAVLAAEMLGSTLQAFEVTVDYLKTRVQFGKPLGAFQTLAHRATDMLGEIELTRSAVQAALQAIDADEPDVPALVSLAKAVAGKTMRHVAREMIQMHGGIGMTNEHDAGLYLKRAQAADVAYGNAAFHRERYATLIGL
jgi:alkylation response protein AidB-like acyl-CoA dehydrogenase